MFIWFDHVFSGLRYGNHMQKNGHQSVLRNSWEDHVADIVTNLSEEEQNSEKFKLLSPSRQATVNWLAEDFSYLQNYPEMIETFFSICGITTHQPAEKEKWRIFEEHNAECQ